MTIHTFTFSSAKGKDVTVSAPTELEARSLAMAQLYGPPFGIWMNRGLGLHLRTTEQANV